LKPLVPVLKGLDRQIRGAAASSHNAVVVARNDSVIDGDVGPGVGADQDVVIPGAVAAADIDLVTGSG